MNPGPWSPHSVTGCNLFLRSWERRWSILLPLYCISLPSTAWGTPLLLTLSNFLWKMFIRLCCAFALFWVWAGALQQLVGIDNLALFEDLKASLCMLLLIEWIWRVKRGSYRRVGNPCIRLSRRLFSQAWARNHASWWTGRITIPASVLPCCTSWTSFM